MFLVQDEVVEVTHLDVVIVVVPSPVPDVRHVGDGKRERESGRISDRVCIEEGVDLLMF